MDTNQNAAPAMNVGEKLRALRTSKGLSIRVLADKARLSPNTISLIEANSTSPTVATLQTIANALGVPLASFFMEFEEDHDAILIKAMDQERMVLPGVKTNVFPSQVLDHQVQVIHFAIDPEVSSGTEPLIHAGNELVICIQGQLEYTVNNRTYVLKKQDSLAFKANLPHAWCNRTHSETHFLVVIFSEEDSPNFYHHSTFISPVP